MTRRLLLILVIFHYACNTDNNNNSGNLPDSDNVKTSNNEFKLSARLNAFDTTVEVLFWDTKDSINNVQRRNYEGFIAKQDSLAPQILQKIFDFYRIAYADYKDGWTKAGTISEKELEKYLPKPTTPENLKRFITPAIVHIQSKQDCIDGTIGIEFDCTWDEENGLGVSIKNWKVAKASVAEVAYF